MDDRSSENEREPTVGLQTIAREWLRIGCIGFGGPPAHIALLRRKCVEERNWISAEEFQDGVATTNLLPGPASTQLAIFCAYRLRGKLGAVIGGLGFICPGLAIILVLSTVFLARHPPIPVLGMATGAGGAVPAVALFAAWGFVPASWTRIGSNRHKKVRWVAYAALGTVSAIVIGPYLVLVLLGCGVIEVVARRESKSSTSRGLPLVGAIHGVLKGGLGSLCWVAIKVGALSYGGGFVIIPLMQHDAVTTYHWLSGSQFLDAVALGQVTPGPVVLTVAVVGYAAHGVIGGLVGVTVAFTPSFLFVIFGGPHFTRIRTSPNAQAFFSGAGPAVIGAIAGSAVVLGRSFTHLWQIPVLALALLWLFVVRKGVVSALALSALGGLVLGLAHVAV